MKATRAGGLYTAEMDDRCGCGRWKHRDHAWCCRPWTLLRGPFRTTEGVLVTQENVPQLPSIIHPEEIADYQEAGLVGHAPRCGETHSAACNMRQFSHGVRTHPDEGGTSLQLPALAAP